MIYFRNSIIFPKYTDREACENSFNPDQATADETRSLQTVKTQVQMAFYFLHSSKLKSGLGTGLHLKFDSRRNKSFQLSMGPGSTEHGLSLSPFHHPDMTVSC